MSVNYNFAGKVVLITGSSSGIGASTAALFARSGAQVVVTGRNGDKVSEVVKICHQLSPNERTALGVVADLTKEDDLKRLVDTTIEKFGRLDVLVNNAGYFGNAGVIEEHFVETYKSVLKTNLDSVVHLTHLCVDYLAQTKGNIVNVSAVASTIAARNLSAYCMSKSALDMFTKCMAVELGDLSIRVNSVNPAAVRTPILENAGLDSGEADKFLEYYASKYPVGRVGEPEDIANVILFLASDVSSFTTGSIVVVDGGHTAANVNIGEK